MNIMWQRAGKVMFLFLFTMSGPRSLFNMKIQEYFLNKFDIKLQILKYKFNLKEIWRRNKRNKIPGVFQE